MPLINFAGIASGIDSEGLISATLDAQRAIRITPLEDKISDFTDTNDAFAELKTKLNALKDTLVEMSTLSNGALTKQAVSSDETILTAVARSDASNGSYTLSNVTLAKNATTTVASSGTTYTSATDVAFPGSAGDTLTVNIGTGGDLQTTVLTINNTTTLTDIATEFNNTSGVRGYASVVNTGTTASPSYKLVFNTTETGTARGGLSITPSAGLTAGNRLNSQTASAATNATFTIAGVGTITRPTNSIADVIPGLTINLVAATSTVSITIQVSDDSVATQQKVQNFVDAYNEVIAFINENDRVVRSEDGGEATNTFAALSKTRVDNNAVTSIKDVMISSRYASGSEIKIFADLGIETDSTLKDGTLKFKTSVFQTALSKEPESVNAVLQVFADAASGTGGTIDQYTGFNRLIDLAKQGNDRQIQDLNRRISTAEAALASQETSLRRQFAALERTIGGLQSQQNQLTSALAGLR